MPRQRNSSHKIKQEKVTARDVIKTDIKNMSDGEFKAKTMGILTGLERSICHYRYLIIINLNL